MTEPRTPFLVTGGECEQIIRDVLAHNEEARVALRTFAEEFGCERIYGDSPLIGLEFPDTPPDGWTHRKRDPSKVYVPRTKALRQRVKDLPAVCDSVDFCRAIRCPIITDEKNIMYWPGFEYVGDRLILMVPCAAVAAGYAPPEGATPLKMSEYWRMKEEAGE